MGEDCKTWMPHLQFGWQSSNFSPLDEGKQRGFSAVTKPGANMVSINGTMPALLSSTAPPQLQLGPLNEPHGWFYCLPRFRQGFTPAPNFATRGKPLAPALNFATEEKPLADSVKDFRDRIANYCESSSRQKQFLVVDQTGGQTTVVYSSRFGNPDECLASWHSKLHGANYLNGSGTSFKRELNLNYASEPTLADNKVDENLGIDTESEMHEDTEEINALLYSDTDGYSSEDVDDDEVTSTGHSPSAMTTHDDHESFKGTAEEVASSAGNSKKRKLLDGYYENVQLMDTTTSLKLNKSFAVGDDSESRCSSGNYKGSGSKKMRKEKIRDVLSVLQSIIPGGKDKDPVSLLDDAIHCLKSLKDKAKALGLDAVQVREF